MIVYVYYPNDETHERYNNIVKVTYESKLNRVIIEHKDATDSIALGIIEKVVIEND